MFSLLAVLLKLSPVGGLSMWHDVAAQTDTLIIYADEVNSLNVRLIPTNVEKLRWLN